MEEEKLRGVVKMREATLQYCMGIIAAQFLHTVDAKTYAAYREQRAYLDGCLLMLDAILSEAHTQNMDSNTAKTLDMYRGRT